MHRFRPPTFQEEKEQIELEYIYEQLFDELGREPTDEEVKEVYNNYLKEYQDKEYYPENFEEEEWKYDKYYIKSRIKRRMVWRKY